MSRIALLSYNNYYNRIYKKESSLGDYIVHSSSYIVLDNINFNPGDGVTTSLVLGKGTGAFLNWEQGSPDYLVVYKDTDETIISRWFILDENRTRAGQYTVTLRRDLLADYQDSLATAPLYIEKGIIEDIESPLLCNHEGLVVNQLKKEERLLKDATECPWLVLYLKKGALGTTSAGTQGKIVIDVPENDGTVYETLNTPIESWSMYQYTSGDYNVMQSNAVIVWYKDTSNSHSGHRYTLNSNGYREFVPRTVNDANIYWVNASVTTLDNQFKPNFNTITNYIKTALGYQNLNGIMQYDNKIIKDSNGRYYLAKVRANNTPQTSKVWIASTNASTAKAYINDLWNAANGSTQGANDKSFQSSVTYIPYRLVLEEVTDVETTIDLAEYTGNGTVDCALYDCICMPYGEVFFSNPGELLYGLTSSRERSLKVMNSIARTLTSNWVLDLQLLPYCPCQELIGQTSDPTIYLLDARNQALYGRKTGTGITDAIIVASKSTFTFNIYESITIGDESEVSGPYKIKYLNDCTSVRLCSPNYNGLFELNLAQNGGSIDYFNVDVTLRPYNPYIHVNPNFKFLYVQDWDDARGLICGGDFSLGIINDAWTQYEIQNKNYQAIFDRQIQNLDVNNSIARQEAGWQIAAGSLQGAAGGAVAGAMVGGGWGAAIGGVVGGGASLGGGILDYINLNKRIDENRSYAIDNFNLQLGNIRALPYSITKTNAQTANNKLFPFVEIYECTDVEKEAYYNKLRYDGMTIGVIGTLDQFTNAGSYNYFKARLIRNTSILGSTHEVQELSNELYKGVYI